MWNKGREGEVENGKGEKERRGVEDGKEREGKE